MKTVGFWPKSVADNDVVSIDFAPNLGTATIVGTPTVAGVNCTATYAGLTPPGVVSAYVSAGTYAGAVEMTATLSDGRIIARQVELRFLL
jgi:hypothetical protein